MGAKAWSKATPEQRERHRQRCIAAGKWRRTYNWVCKIHDGAQKLNIDGCDYLLVWDLIMQNKKFPVDLNKGQKMLELLRQKMKPDQVYQIVFGS
ncbi:MAG: hypothetical protein CVU54_09675 [Deltaproteobacteria bacterium HGW-Deltaproteobacteria-12]|jgi:hypothetical protein|nr:MAG: hypothetical protein CVU54_09675 [Deltaproteobacteria bacterium HGW-Deltaproteobacteria-12]